MESGGENPSSAGEPSNQKRHAALYIFMIILTALVVGGVIFWIIRQTIFTNVTQTDSPTSTVLDTTAPKLKAEPVIKGLSHPWDVAFLPSKQMIFTERKGTVSTFKDGLVTELNKISDVYAVGEGGLMGLAVDPKFSENHHIYTCFNSTRGGYDVRVTRWKVTENVDNIVDRQDIVTGMPMLLGGRHSGCRIAFGPDGFLWIGTGDAATGANPQNPKSLGGKILRVDRDGKAASGNMGGDFDARIYSYGHRNTQGLAFAPKAINGVVGYSVEHGSSEDDEINPLVKGNFGWDPPAPYEETGTPMTDKVKFPNAIEPIWKSGAPTVATGGATFLTGKQWKAWDGALAVAHLKDAKLFVLKINSDGSAGQDYVAFKDTFGRLRSAVEGPDGALYLTTDNNTDDKIIRVTPE